MALRLRLTTVSAPVAALFARCRARSCRCFAAGIFTSWPLWSRRRRIFWQSVLLRTLSCDRRQPALADRPDFESQRSSQGRYRDRKHWVDRRRCASIAECDRNPDCSLFKRPDAAVIPPLRHLTHAASVGAYAFRCGRSWATMSMICRKPRRQL